MTYRLIFPEPRIFFSNKDEKVFFRWLEGIREIGRVTRVSNGLEAHVVLPISDRSLRELIALLTRYGLDKRCLAPLVSDDNEAWFKNKKMYWYRSVFTIRAKR